MKHTGGGWYTLSNGERVRGKANAEAAEAAIGGGRTLAKVVGVEHGEPRKLAKVVET